MPAWLDRLEASQDEGLASLKELLSIPSVSTDPGHREDCRKAAEWLVDRLQALGFQGGLEVVDDGLPLIHMELELDPEADWVCLYGHYDVQPPDPLDAWTTPPFEPTVYDGDRIRARGATDDKGQLFANLRAIEAHVAAGTLEVNLRVLIEGEEEVGGHSLPRYIQENRDALASDVVIVSDTHLWDAQTPSIVHGMRGIVTMEATVHGPDRDLHSGQFGGIVMNPAEALARAVGGLKDGDLHVTVPGFYDDVRELDDAQRSLMDAVPFSAEAFLAGTGVEVPMGEAGYTPQEQLWARPSLEVNGLTGGYAGDGFKTVLPASATVKLSVRTVPDQNPDAIGQAVLDHLEGLLPTGVRLEGEVLQAAPAWYASPDHPVLEIAGGCLTEAFGNETLYIREGATIPVIPTLESLGPVVLMGYGMTDERLHAPDEFFRLEHFWKGSEAFGRVLERFGER